MELIQSPKKHDPKYLHKKGNSNINVDGVESAEEGNVNKNQKGRTSSSFPMAAYMNSNVQCVNNSLLYHTSCSHHNPGVRLSLSKKPFGEGFHLKEHADGHNTWFQKHIYWICFFSVFWLAVYIVGENKKDGVINLGHGMILILVLVEESWRFFTTLSGKNNKYVWLIITALITFCMEEILNLPVYYKGCVLLMILCYLFLHTLLFL